MNLLVILLSSIFVNNFVLSKFLGICSFLGVSKKRSSAIGMGLAVIFVMTLSSVMCWLVYTQILQRFKIEYMSTLAYVLVIAALVQFVEMVIKKMSPGLYKALGIYLPLITTNCAVLGIVIINMNESYNLIEAIVSGFGGAVGYALGLLLLTFIRERTDNNPAVPEVLKGLPITLFTAGLMSIAFLGFQGLIQ